MSGMVAVATSACACMGEGRVGWGVGAVTTGAAYRTVQLMYCSPEWQWVRAQVRTTAASQPAIRSGRTGSRLVAGLGRKKCVHAVLHITSFER